MEYSLFFIIAAPALLYYYLGDFRSIAITSYIILISVSLYSLNNKSSIKNIIALSFLGGLFITYALVYNNITGLIYAFRLNFGFVFYIIAIQYIRLPKLETIAIVLALITLIEFTVINIHPGLIEILPNYNKIFSESFSSGGVHSFGGNRTVTGVLLLAIYSYLEKISAARFTKFLVITGVLISGSGTAYSILLLYFGYRARSQIVYIIIFCICVYLFLIADLEEFLYLEKFNSEYINFIFEYKLDQINDLKNKMNFSSYFFGIGDLSFVSSSAEIDGYGSLYGDFLLLDFFARYGLLGASSLLFFVFFFVNRTSFIPVLIIVGGTLHYHVLFSTPGQLIIAILIVSALKKDNLNYKKFEKPQSNERQIIQN